MNKELTKDFTVRDLIDFLLVKIPWSLGVYVIFLLIAKCCGAQF